MKTLALTVAAGMAFTTILVLFLIFIFGVVLMIDLGPEAKAFIGIISVSGGIFVVAWKQIEGIVK